MQRPNQRLVERRRLTCLRSRVHAVICGRLFMEPVLPDGIRQPERQDALAFIAVTHRATGRLKVAYPLAFSALAIQTGAEGAPFRIWQASKDAPGSITAPSPNASRQSAAIPACTSPTPRPSTSASWSTAKALSSGYDPTNTATGCRAGNATPCVSREAAQRGICIMQARYHDAKRRR